MSFDLPNKYLQSINHQQVQLIKNKEIYECTDNLIKLYDTQLKKYDKIKSNKSATEIANKLTNFFKNTRNTFDEKTLKLTTHLDNRITNDKTWCSHNNLKCLGNNIYYVQYNNDEYFFGCKITENIVSFNLFHLDKIKSEIETAIQNLKEKLVKLKKERISSIDKIDDIIKKNKIKYTSTLERIQEEKTEILNKKKKYNEIDERLTNKYYKVTEDELTIQTKIKQNDLNFLNIKTIYGL
jgi:hypothetical protein